MSIARILTAAGLAGALLLAAGVTVAAEPGPSGEVVAKAIANTMRTYNDKGELTGEVTTKGLVFPLKVVGHDAKGRPGVMLNGQQVFLKPADIILSGTTAACTPIATAKKASDSRLAASEVGVSAGMSEHAVACLPVAK